MGRGQPCGASHISASYTCRLDGNWEDLAVGPKSKAKIATVTKTYELLNKEQQTYWGQKIDGSLRSPGKSHHENGKPYTAAEMDSQVASRANAWNTLIKDGPPNQLKLRNGELFDAPAGMTPNVTDTGQKGWRHPETDRLFTHKGNFPKKEGGGRQPDEQNRAGKEDSDRRAKDMIDFKKKQGEAWPTQTVPPEANQQPMSADKIMSGLSQKDKNAIVYNGLDFTHGEGKALRQYYEKNPAEKQARLREVVERYAAQNGQSGVTGKPIALPGVKPKPGQERSSVDHFQPISTDRGTKLTGKQLRERADNGGNFLLTEEALNSQRSNRPWDSYAKKSEERLAKAGSGGGKTKRSGSKEVVPAPRGESRAEVGSSKRQTRVRREPAKPVTETKPRQQSQTTTEQRNATRKFMQEKLAAARADRRSADVAAWEAQLRKLGTEME